MPRTRQEIARRRRLFLNSNAIEAAVESEAPPPLSDAAPEMPDFGVPLDSPALVEGFKKGAAFIEDRPELAVAFQRIALDPSVEDARYVVDTMVREDVLTLDALEEMAAHLDMLSQVFVSAVAQAKADARASQGG